MGQGKGPGRPQLVQRKDSCILSTRIGGQHCPPEPGALAETCWENSSAGRDCPHQRLVGIVPFLGLELVGWGVDNLGQVVPDEGPLPRTQHFRPLCQKTGQGREGGE
eukprot:3830615-Rhodomonas_salina.1